MLAGLDTLVVDLQDVGVRSYTYISCMRYAMEACFEQGIEVVVLDRPNPLGGTKVDGPPLDQQWRSYVGAFHVPYVHGMTIGELARMAKNSSGWMEVPENRRRGKLTVIRCAAGNANALARYRTEVDPDIPLHSELISRLGYAMTGLGAQEEDLPTASERLPFRFLRHKGKSPEEVKRALESQRISGFRYRMSKRIRELGLLFVVFMCWSTTGMLFARPKSAPHDASHRSVDSWKSFAESSNPTLFNKHVGSTAWWSEISGKGAQARVTHFVQNWSRMAARFQGESQRFWLY